MLAASVRSILASLSRTSAGSPIEVITVTVILITLVYFQLITAIKGSDIFALPQPAPPTRPVQLARLAERDAHSAAHSAYSHSPYWASTNSNWTPLSAASFRRALESNALEGGYVFPSSEGGNSKGEHAAIVLVKQLTVVHEGGDDAASEAWRRWVVEDVGVNVHNKFYTYSDLCFNCEDNAEPSLEVNSLHSDQSTLTLFLRAPSPDTPTLTYLAHLAKLPQFTAPGTNVTLAVLKQSADAISWPVSPTEDGTTMFANLAVAKASAEVERNPAVRKARWVAYAVRVLFFRFYSLARNADSADIFVVLLGYLAMHYVFVRLFVNMRRLGSNFWLPLGTLISSTFAFLCALLTAYLLNVTIDPIILSEAIPFVVITVGFDKPFRLAQAVFQHPDISPIPSSPEVTPLVNDVPNEGGLGLDLGLLHRELAPIERLQKLAEGKGIRWVAPVAAKRVVADAVATAGSSIVRDYALEIAVLAIGSASGIGGVREFCSLVAFILVFDCALLFTFFVAILTVMVEVHRIKLIHGNKRAKSALKRNASTMSLPSQEPTGPNSRSSSPNRLEKGDGQPSNPLPRLKLFLLISFLVLHVLNLCTTLTDQTALKRYSTHGVNHPRVIDTSSTNLAPLLEKLYNSLPVNIDMIVQIVTPTQILMSQNGPSTSRIESIDNFMSEWTVLVGDPIISKWIVVTLAISVLLNGYLLKGIASNSIGGNGPVAAAANALVGIFDAVEQPRRTRSNSVSRNTDGAIVVKGHKSRASIATIRGDGDKTPTHINGHANGHADTNGHAKPTLNGDSRPYVAPVVPKIPVIAEPVLDKSDSAPNTQVPLGRRSLEECVDIYAGGVGASNLSDEEIIMLVQNSKIAPYALEKQLKNLDRAVRVRRAVISRASLTGTLEASLLPMNDYDYQAVMGACCENVIGYMPLPVGIAGPLNIDGQMIHIPMATTEGTLVASTSRGCKALNAGGGVTTVLSQDAMTRGPAIDFPSVKMAAAAKIWIDSEEGFHTLSTAFNSTSRFARLQHLKTALAGRTLYVRFATSTGDAMGMNMISKGTEKSLEVLQQRYPEMDVLALSGNYCTDKKPAAINWIEGRGKSVVAEGIVPRHVVKNVLKTTVKELVNLNKKKNLIGSAMAGSIGGFNAHAANILTAIFIATGQDPAQNVESSMCMTLMEETDEGDLLITCSMPSIECGTVGGGTILGPQRAMLEFLGIAGPHPTTPGRNSQRLARIISAAVMAGELSLMSALAAGHLIQAHMKHNRSVPVTPGAVTPFGGITPIREHQLVTGQLKNTSPKLAKISPTKLNQVMTWEDSNKQ